MDDEHVEPLAPAALEGGERELEMALGAGRRSHQLDLDRPLAGSGQRLDGQHRLEAAGRPAPRGSRPASAAKAALTETQPALAVEHRDAGRRGLEDPLGVALELAAPPRAGPGAGPTSWAFSIASAAWLSRWRISSMSSLLSGVLVGLVAGEDDADAAAADGEREGVAVAGHEQVRAARHRRLARHGDARRAAARPRSRAPRPGRRTAARSGRRRLGADGDQRSRPGRGRGSPARSPPPPRLPSRSADAELAEVALLEQLAAEARRAPGACRRCSGSGAARGPRRWRRRVGTRSAGDPQAGDEQQEVARQRQLLRRRRG